MSSAIKEIAVPKSAVKSPKGLLRSIISRFALGSRFAIGLVIFLLGITLVVMIARKLGVPTGKVESLAG